MGVADFEGDGEGQARYTLAGLGDHGGVGVDTGYPSVRPDPLDEAARFVPESAAHIQDLIAFADWAGIEHLLPDLLDGGIPVHAVKPAEDGLGVNRLTCLLEPWCRLLTVPSPTIDTSAALKISRSTGVRARAAVPVHSMGRLRRGRLTAPLAHSAEHSPRKGKVHGSNP